MYLNEEVQVGRSESDTFDFAQFNLLYKSWSFMLQKYADYYLKDMEASSSVVNDVFVQLWLGKKKPERLKAYLYRAVKNSCLNYLSQKRKIAISYFGADELTIISDLSLDANNEVSDDDKLLFLESVISRLPQKRQLVFRMHRLEGLSYAEIAELLEISIRTVEDHLSKSMQFIHANAKHLVHQALTKA